MKHSDHYDQVKSYFNMKMWNETRVRNAVTMGWITASEFTEITEKDY